MAQEKKLEVDITVTNSDLIFNGNEFGYKLNKNFEDLGYDNGNALVRKKLLRPDQVPVNNIIGLNGGELVNRVGGFNGEVHTIEYFTYREENIRLIAIGGEFSQYIKDSTVTACNGFIILDNNGDVYKANTAPYDIIDTSGAIVYTIRYHADNDTLLIGGDFTSVGNNTDVKYFFEYSILDEFFSPRTFNMAQDLDSPNGIVRTIDVLQRTGTIFLGGDFTSFLNVTAEHLFAMDSNFTLPENTLYSNFKNLINTYTVINKVLVKQTGELQISIGGDFEVAIPQFISNTDGNASVFNIIVSNFIIVDALANPLEKVEAPNGEVKDIALRSTTYYVVGEFDTFGGLTVNNGFRININGEGVRDLGFPEEVTSINVIAFAEYGIPYIGFTPLTQNYNFCKLNLNSLQVTNKINVNSKINTLSYLDEDGGTFDVWDLLIGGDVLSYNFPINNLGRDEIELSDTLSVTINNILNNLREYNTRDTDLGFKYSLVGTDTIRITKIIERQDDLYYLSSVKNIGNKVVISVNSNDSDFDNIIKSVPLRKDYIVKSSVNTNWSKAEFTIGDIVITKNRLMSNQLNQYLNITKILKDESYEADITYFEGLDFGGLTPTIQPSRIGGFSSVGSKTFLQQTEIDNKSFIGFLHDGYNQTKSILLNGNKRVITDRLVIPFLTSDIQNIEFTYQDGTTKNVINPNYQNINPKDASFYINYLCIKNEDITGFVNIDFRDGEDNIVDTIKVYNRENNSLYSPVEVIFKNSFGALEIVSMNGRSIDDINTDSDSFKRSNRDINGNIKLPNKHTNKTYNKSGTKKWTLNTGNIQGFMNDSLEDLAMSEEIRLKKDGKTIPVIGDGRRFNKKDDLEELINYTFSFTEDININE